MSDTQLFQSKNGFLSDKYSPSPFPCTEISWYLSCQFSKKVQTIIVKFVNAALNNNMDRNSN
jgi:hypothetical protein